MNKKVYSIASPLDTHTRPATCTEVGCQAQENGWIVPVDESSDLGQRQAFYIRNHSGRAHTESREGPSTVFQFPPGQQCFINGGHRVSLERPEFYVVRDRGQAFQHSGPDPWLDDCSTHLDYLRKVRG